MSLGLHRVLTHSFIDVACAMRLHLLVLKLPFDLIVSILALILRIGSIHCVFGVSFDVQR